MKNMKVCKKCGMYPSRFDKCPICSGGTSAPAPKLTPEQVAKAIATSLDRDDIDANQIKG